MAKRKSFTVAGETFCTKKALIEHIRGILYSYQEGEILSETDRDFMADLLKRHPEYEQKTGAGIWYIYVQKNPVFPTMGFWIKRLDGTETDFSFMECLKETPHRKRFERACRTAVHPAILDFKQRFFADLGADSYPCPYTGEPLMYQNCHIDHAEPFTFQRLVNDFISQCGIDVAAVHIGGKGEDGVVYDYFTDQELAQRWIDYHNRNARLQVVSRRANLSLLRRTYNRKASNR